MTTWSEAAVDVHRSPGSAGVTVKPVGPVATVASVPARSVRAATSASAARTAVGSTTTTGSIRTPRTAVRMSETKRSTPRASRPTARAWATSRSTSARRPRAAYGIVSTPSRVVTLTVPWPYPASERVSAAVACACVHARQVRGPDVDAREDAARVLLVGREDEAGRERERGGDAEEHAEEDAAATPRAGRCRRPVPGMPGRPVAWSCVRRSPAVPDAASARSRGCGDGSPVGRIVPRSQPEPRGGPGGRTGRCVSWGAGGPRRAGPAPRRSTGS